MRRAAGRGLAGGQGRRNLRLLRPLRLHLPVRGGAQVVGFRVPRRGDRRPPPPGLHTYRIPLDGGQMRLHLRVEHDGSGVLFR
ncbi:hypothetical protein RZS08_43915, partial [Arthrospira platensis SPKY1]|nr:hypothetical protein [Arthrospira platensis SPKY1]